YARLAESAEELQQWHAFFTLEREAVRSIDATDLTLYKALAHARLAEAATRAGRNHVAAEEISRSERLFSQISADQSLPAYRSEAEVNRAKLEAARGDYSSALDRLEKLKPVEGIENYLVKFNFYLTEASIREARKENTAATDGYRLAVRLVAS